MLVWQLHYKRLYKVSGEVNNFKLLKNNNLRFHAEKMKAIIVPFIYFRAFHCLGIFGKSMTGSLNLFIDKSCLQY